MAQEDIRVLIPRVRRAVEGVGTPEVLTDDEIKDLTADAIADIILFTGGVFGKQLLVTEVDGTTNAPIEYATSEPLTLPEGSVVASQAALNHIFTQLRELKTSETIRDEGQEWTYATSATLFRDWIAFLQKTRDQALEEVEAYTPLPVAWYSYIAERDRAASLLLEPYYYTAP
jgi:hypothetical protein